MKKKLIIAVVILGIILTVVGVGTTVSHLIDREEIVNEFEGTVVKGVAVGDTVEKLAVKNQESSGIPVYVRLCVTPNYTYTDQGTSDVYYCADTPDTSADVQQNPHYRNGKPRDVDYSYKVNADWLEGNDGYFYYRHHLPAGSTTPQVFSEFKIINETNHWQGRDYYFTVETAYEIIQCEDPTAVTADYQAAVIRAWGVTLENGRPKDKITKAP